MTDKKIVLIFATAIIAFALGVFFGLEHKKIQQFVEPLNVATVPQPAVNKN